ncbi:superoxide dismutase family protein [Jannaschia rubra]|uniref:Superoxide dismutase-like protein YojM n=1 Tax=Jannaschia rubra TaxID=282197 RepID=A0A0M6XP02_9RHOB|nr:superoxide dismutase family protein [Jannaschia rubra]CTQ31845.1 Superoxide dismutase-like protein YojM precursor [Jannaschia rubra]SFG52461.1 superoxide dismutase, Cu-Zn family [Jannaschia rubra]
MRLNPVLPLVLSAVIAAPAFADNHVGPRLTGEIVNPAGENIGSVSLFETASGVIRVNVQATGLAPGAHGVHIHETGVCEGDFSSAGGHLSGGMEHGLVAGGPHPGDLPNGFVGDDGVLSMEALTTRVDINQIEDEDGSALVIHSGPDDYESQPAGDAGDRVACAVLSAS